MTKAKLNIIKASYHRNGISGEGFYAVIFKDDDFPNLTFIASVFDESGYCSVYAIEELEKHNIEFAKGNSWRGDDFQFKLRPLIEQYFKNHKSNRIGIFALPD